MNNTLLLQVGGTIEARASFPVTQFIIVVALVAAVVAGVFFIARYLTTYKKSAAYLEKQKKRPTKLSDIQEIAHKCKLISEEKDILWAICRDNNAPNILYLVHDLDMLEDLFKAEFNIYDSEKNEKAKSYLFSLRKKIRKEYFQLLTIKNSKSIESNTMFTYTPAQGYHHKLALAENNRDGLVLIVPDTLNDNPDKPKPLTKIELIFEGSDGSPYTLETRVIRYEKGKTGLNLMLTVHSDKIVPLKKRDSERIDINMPCKFSSVKTTVEGKGKKETIIYEHSDKLHDGILEDVSTGGCRMVSDLPIRAEQYIYVEGPMNTKTTDSAIGSIVRTTKRKDGKFILHVRFLKIEVDVVNRIQAKAYGFDS